MYFIFLRSRPKWAHQPNIPTHDGFLYKTRSVLFLHAIQDNALSLQYKRWPFAIEISIGGPFMQFPLVSPQIPADSHFVCLFSIRAFFQLVLEVYIFYSYVDPLCREFDYFLFFWETAPRRSLVFAQLEDDSFFSVIIYRSFNLFVLFYSSLRFLCISRSMIWWFFYFNLLCVH